MDTEQTATEKFSQINSDQVETSQMMNTEVAETLISKTVDSESFHDPTKRDESRQMTNGNQTSQSKETNGDQQFIGGHPSSISRTTSQASGTMNAFESRGEHLNGDKNQALSNGQSKNVKRDDYLVWEDYFMSVALLSAKRSKDPSTQVGACIVNNDNKIVSIGYNGMPVNCNDDLLPWGKSSNNELENKYLYVCHAELNCVLNSNTFSLKDCAIYVTLFPCNECAKVIIQAGIKKIYYLDKKKEEKPEYIASKRLLDMANVKLIHYKPKEQEVVLKLKVDD